MIDPSPRFILLMATAGLAALSHPAAAQVAPAPVAPAPPEEGGHESHDTGPEIIVTGRLVSGQADPVSAPVVLQGDALAENVKPQIGDMLASLPGVSASGFAPGASRPVLRGFDGPRVQVLTDGLGSLDASSVSADHAVSLDTLNVARVDVIHGPRVLLYASDPAGGAVNAADKRIPREVPEAPLRLDALASYGTAADLANGGFSSDLRLAPRWVLHVDAAYHHSNDLHVGGSVLSPAYRAGVLAQAADLADQGDGAGAARLTEAANQRDTLANSWTEGWSYGAGLAFIDAGGDIGVSVQRLASDYGIPPRPSANLDLTSISLRQTRFDWRAGVNLAGFLKRLSLRGAVSRYEHAEISDGAVGTRFDNHGLEVRAEAEQANHGGWTGTTGVQFASSDMTISGEERLLPDNDTDRFAVFSVQQMELGNFDLEAALRWEHTAIRVSPGQEGRSFVQHAAAAGLAWHPLGGVTLSLSFAHGERAPSAEELYVDGAHDATQSYERGDRTFTVERSDGVEMALRYNGGAIAGSLTLYGSDYANFITAVPTGATIDALPVYQYIQAPARFRGIEAEAAVTALNTDSGAIKIDGGMDYTHATLRGIGPVPRIPALRVRGGIGWESAAFDLRADVEWNAAQNRVAENELPTDAYTLVGLSAIWRPAGKGGPLTLILSADNLLDVNGRLAASETRDFVPIAGRDLKATAKISF